MLMVEKVTFRDRPFIPRTNLKAIAPLLSVPQSKNGDVNHYLILTSFTKIASKDRSF